MRLQLEEDEKERRGLCPLLPWTLLVPVVQRFEFLVIDLVSTLLGAGASLDPSCRVSTLSIEECLRFQHGPFTDQLVALFASVRAAGSWADSGQD